MGAMLGEAAQHLQETMVPDRDNLPVYAKSDKEMAFLLKALKAPHVQVLFGHLPEPDLRDICLAMYQRRVEAHEVVIAQGSRGHEFFVVAEGEFQTYVMRRDDPTRDPDVVKRDIPGGSFGELSLAYGCSRQASVSSTIESAVYVLDSDIYNQRFRPSTTPVKFNAHAKFLDATPLFQMLTMLEKQQLGLALGEELRGSGEVIFVAGEVPKSFYILLDGGVMLKTETGEEHVVTETGKVFGELTLNEKKRHVCTAVALESGCSLLVLPAERSAMLGPIKQEILLMAPSKEYAYLW